MPVLADIYSIFQPLTDVFEAVLKFFHNTGGIPWGWSIVLLTIAVRAVLVPLTLRQVKSMVRMQALAPQMKEIQQKYKADKQRQQQEMMKFYRENNVNPFGSCLPLLLQLPVFFALYAMLRESLRVDICPDVQMAHNHGVLSIHHTVPCGSHPASSFLFIPDLTSQATGITLIVLLLLYVGSQLGSSVVMSSASMDQNQRRMMMFMPVIFVVFIYRFPAGLLVYWITTNLWTIGQQYFVKRRMGPTVAVAGAEAGSGGAVAATGPPTRSPGSGSATSASAAGSGGSGTSGGSSGGGLGARLRERMRAAQEAAAASNATKNSGGGSETATRDRGGSGNGAEVKTNGDGAGRGSRRSGRGSRSGGDGSGAKSSGAKSSGAKSSGAKSSGAKSSGGKSGNGGDGASSARSGGPPPRPPRKKKKRSGRRR